MTSRQAFMIVAAILFIPACSKDDASAAPAPNAAAPAATAPAASGEEHRREHEHEGDGGREHGEHEAK